MGSRGSAVVITRSVRKLCYSERDGEQKANCITNSLQEMRANGPFVQRD